MPVASSIPTFARAMATALEATLGRHGRHGSTPPFLVDDWQASPVGHNQRRPTGGWVRTPGSQLAQEARACPRAARMWRSTPL